MPAFRIVRDGKRGAGVKGSGIDLQRVVAV
jgi:hypothetical protein